MTHFTSHTMHALLKTNDSSYLPKKDSDWNRASVINRSKNLRQPGSFTPVSSATFQYSKK